MTTLITLVAVLVVLAIAWSAGRLVRVLGQPPVIGELAAGILLGPSVLGALAPEMFASIFSAEARALIGWLSQAAVLVFMFLVGLELDTATLRRHAAGVARIAIINLILPFTIGVILAWQLYPSLHGPEANRLAFVLFGGTAFSITALPVLTRILTDWRMLTTTIGTVAVGCAAIDDIVAWTLLGLVSGLVHGHSGLGWLVLFSAGYVMAMLFVIRPALNAIAVIRRTSTGRALWLVIVAATATASALVTDAIGIHAVFGAFVAGACVPRQHDVLEGLDHPLKRASAMLMPAFFVLIGLKTDFGRLQQGSDWLIVATIVALATIGKFGGGAIAARTLRFSWKDSLAIGALLNTRGLVGLVALDIGRTLGILSPALFTMCVVMTFITTFAAAPALRMLGFRPL